MAMSRYRGRGADKDHDRERTIDMDRIILEGTLTKVTSSRAQKAELTLGKVEMCWQIRDPEQVGFLTMLQNGIVRITIENPQMEMFRREAENRQYGLDFENEVAKASLEKGAVRYLPGYQAEDGNLPGEEESLGEEVSAEELEEECKG